MIAKRQLEELASALKAAPEYAEMVRQRGRIMGNPTLSRLLQGFEREHRRLLGLDLPEKEAAAQFEKLYTDNKNFLENEDIRRYIKAAKDYQKMISENVNYLNMLLEAGNSGKRT
jgi:hypothetical protein